MAELKFQKPFLKWVGGKTQIIHYVLDKFPNEINNYHEIFLGGGSVLLALLSLQKQQKKIIRGDIYAYDINGILIDVYKNIQNNRNKLFFYISKYFREYDNINGTTVNRKPTNLKEALSSKESYYYWQRSQFNKFNKFNKKKKTEEKSIICSGLFIFLNKTCFRGVYREGPNGFNVPYGHYKTTPTCITKKELDYISELIKDVKFIQRDFKESLKNTKEGDFIYLDPPYAPENDNSFVGYTSGGFDLETHKKLFSEITELNNKKIRFALSNVKVNLVMDYFKDYNYEEIIARRAINSKKPESKTTEVIIYNYK